MYLQQHDNMIYVQSS